MPFALVRRASRSLCGCALGALVCAVAHAQSPAASAAPSLRQLHHTAWTVRDGAPASVVAIAQTADGSLWLGSSTGLFRFDGVRFERFEPPAGQTLPSSNVSALRVLPGDSLWIGYGFGGASVLADGRLVHHGPPEGMPSSTVRQFARDASGGVWAATQAGLFARVGDRWRNVGIESGLSGGFVAALLFDRRGTLWVAADDGVFARPRGARAFVRRAIALGNLGEPGLQEGRDGSVWGASTTRGLVQLADSTGGPLLGALRASGDSSQALLFDPAGGAWLPGGEGVVWIPRPTSPAVAPTAGVGRQKLSRTEGLSGAIAWTIFRDREGSVWVGTSSGLDRFRATKLTAVLPQNPPAFPAIAAGDSGTLWMKSQSEPLRVLGSRIVAYSLMPGGATCAYRDLDGGVWLGGERGRVWQVRGRALFPVAVPAAATERDVQAIARDRDDRLWISVLGTGVFRRGGGVWDRFQASEELTGPAIRIVADRDGRTWLGYPRDRLARVVGDSVRVYGAADGLRVGNVAGLQVRGDRVWVGGELGVMYLDEQRRGARFRTLATSDGPIRGVSGIVETADGELWLNGGEGVTRVPAAELRRALRDSTYRVRAERFDYRDGVDGAPPQIRPLPTAIEGTDGRLWFTTTQGLTWVDPARIARNPLPPPARLRFLDAGGRRYAASGPVTLPARTTALSIGYTAASLAVPDRVRFRYRLDGLDTAWQDVGARREAFYTNLGPGPYRFRVIAANDDGLWNEVGASLDFDVPPTFVQSNAFLVLCAVGTGGAVWLLVHWRQRRVAGALRVQFDAALAERTRIARELHDTLLSGMSGLLMAMGAAAIRARAPGGVDVAALDALCDQTRRTLVEAREAVVALRISIDPPLPLDTRLADAASRIFAGTGIDTRVIPSGMPRALPPEVDAQIVRVAAEAMTNARTHATCRVVEVTCDYAEQRLTVRVRDDGRGFDAAGTGAPGHYGLVGMRERAVAIGAMLTVESTPGGGTTVRLDVPTAIDRLAVPTSVATPS